MERKECPYCKATETKSGKPLSHAGAYNLHVMHCERKYLKNQHQEQTNIKEDEECNHVWRLLSKRQDVEFQALLSGYKEVCSKCQELR